MRATLAVDENMKAEAEAWGYASDDIDMQLSRVLSFYKIPRKRELLGNIRHDLMPNTKYTPHGDERELIDYEVDEFYPEEGQIEQPMEFEDLLELDDPPIHSPPVVHHPFNSTELYPNQKKGFKYSKVFHNWVGKDWRGSPSLKNILVSAVTSN